MDNLNSGIYSIENKTNGKTYIGSSVNLKRRLNCHQVLLSTNRHPNQKLQRSWNKHGSENFVIEVLEYLQPTKEILLAREQHWIELLDVVATGYNILPTAGSSLGTKLSEETRAKMRAAAVGKIRPATSEESKKLQSIAALNRAPVSETTREKIRTLHKGAKRSDEMKAKMRAIALARPPRSAETTEKIRRTTALNHPSTMNVEKWYETFMLQYSKPV